MPKRRMELTEKGLSTREIGEVLGVGDSTVQRDQQAAPNGADEPAEPSIDGGVEGEAAPNGADEPLANADSEPEDATVVPAVRFSDVVLDVVRLDRPVSYTHLTLPTNREV